jgi:hypothetical protein
MKIQFPLAGKCTYAAFPSRQSHTFYPHMCPYLAVLRELDRLLSGCLTPMVRAAHSLGEISHYVDKFAEPW